MLILLNSYGLKYKLIMEYSLNNNGKLKNKEEKEKEKEKKIPRV